MSFAVIDDVFPTHPKAMPLSDKAFRLFITGLCYCTRNLTDGALTKPALGVVLAESRAKQRHVVELADAGLWDRAADGYIVHDFHEFNPTSEQVKERRKARADAGRLGGIRSGQARRDKSKQNEANASKQNGKHRGSTPSPPMKDLKPLGDEPGLFQIPTLRETA